MLLSSSGVWTYNVVAVTYTYQVTRSAFIVGMISVAQFGPQFAFSPLAGAMADRNDRLHQILVGRLLVVLGSGGLGVWMIAGGGLPGVWPVFVSAFTVGIGFVIFGPAHQALVPALAPPHDLPAAVAMIAIPPTLARIGGPVVGAAVAVWFGAGTGFVLAAAANVAAVWLLWSLRDRVRTRASKPPSDQRVRAGLRHVLADRTVGRLLLGIAAVGMTADPVLTLSPALAEEVGGSPSLVGVLVASYGAAAALSFLVLSRLRRRLGVQLASAGLLLTAVGHMAAGWSWTPALAVLGLACAGAGFTLSITSLNTQLQGRVPDGLRGRIMSLWAVAFGGSRPIAAAMNGFVADRAGTRAAFTLVAVLTIAASSVVWASHVERTPPGDHPGPGKRHAPG